MRITKWTNQMRKCTALAMMTGLLMAVSAQSVWAIEKINSVSVTLDLNLEAGDTLPSDLDTGDIGDTSAQVKIPSNSRYDISSAEISSSGRERAELGKTYTVKVYLSDKSGYEFRSSYSESKVTVKGGTFVKARLTDRDYLEVTLKTKPVEGILEEPNDVEWLSDEYKNSKFGHASWDAVKYSNYDTTLYRDGKVVHRVTDWESTSFNFYPYMTKEGDYSFKVRAIPKDADTKKFADRSEWVESDEMYVAENEVSDGSGQGMDTVAGLSSPVTEVGWLSREGKWYFRYPDGNYVRDTWLKVSGIWYLFGANGEMLTGWQKANNVYYFMNGDGAMQTGWLNQGGKWYFLNPDGAMQTGWLNLNNVWYYLNGSGEMCTGWVTVGSDLYYFYPDGHMAANEIIDQLFYVGPSGAWVRP